MYRKVFIAVLLTGITMCGLYLSVAGKRVEQGDIRQDIRSYFSCEQQYSDYIKNEVKFKSVEFKFVTIKPGSNFWKVAKEHGVNIDSLIGVNIFWQDLKARTNQVVIVPSEPGTVEFVTDLDQVNELAKYHNVDASELEVQKLPVFYSLYYKFLGERKPVAVFIHDAKPCAGNMTANLAGKYRQRELFRSPLGGRLSSFFGNRKHPIFNVMKFHDGLDIAAGYGTPIGAARDGVVVSAGWDGGYGKAVTIDHGDGYTTLYGHMSVIYAKPGQRVKAGRIIGRVGSTGLSTGPHLHFSLRNNGKLLNPLDILW